MGCRSVSFWVALCAVLVAGSAQAQYNQDPNPPQEVKKCSDFQHYYNERVAIVAIAGDRMDDGRSSTRMFKIHDLYSGSGFVRANTKWPVKGLHYKFVGTVTFDQNPSVNTWVIIQEDCIRWDPEHDCPWGGGTSDPVVKGRLSVSTIPAGANVTVDGMPRGVTPTVVELDPGDVYIDITKDGYKPVRLGATVTSNQLTPVENIQLTREFAVLPILIAVAALVFLTLVGLLVYVATRRPGADASGAVGSQAGSTIQIPLPSADALSAGTVQVLPGRFEILKGEESIPEIRLMVNAQNPNYTFDIKRGESSNSQQLHEILFTHNSVSSDQGQIIYTNGEYTIVNHADPNTKNPITVDGKRLAKGDSVTLQGGETISIGIVELKYHK